MNHQYYEPICERGPVRVAWVCLGEGYNGNYDPTNPEDELLLRFDLSVKDGDSGDFETVESRRTCFAEKASTKDKEAALDILLSRFHAAYTADSLHCIEMLADKLSYISAGTYRSLALDSGQNEDSITRSANRSSDGHNGQDLPSSAFPLAPAE